MDVFKTVLKKYAPSAAERRELGKKVKVVVRAIETSLVDNTITAQVVVGGSSAKGTYLKHDFDCDIFVRFAYAYRSKNISNLLEQVLEGFDAQRVHGSRDYFQFKENGVAFEVVPVLLVDGPEQARNVTDMSPFHIAWVTHNITPRLRDQILLAKLFCKAQRIYGAESYIRGFSGHVLDILILHYGSFLKLLKAAVTWQNGEVIDVERHGSAQELNDDKRSPLIVIDPVQPERNAAAALNLETFERFKTVAKQFLTKPAERFFVRKKITEATIRRSAGKNDLFVFTVVGLEGKEDVIGAKIRKVFEHMQKEIAKHGFTLLKADWEFDKIRDARLWFVTKPERKDKTYEYMGPPLSAKLACQAFKKKHPKTHVKNNRLYTHVSRVHRSAASLLKAVVKDEYVTERVAKIRQVKL